MKYFDLRISPTKALDGKMTMTEETSKQSVKEFSIDQIIPVLLYDWDKVKGQSIERRVDMKDMVALEGVKTRLVAAESDVVEFSEDAFKLLKTTLLSYEGVPTSLMDYFVALCTRLEETESQKEEDGKKLYDEAKAGDTQNIGDFYRGQDVEVVIEEKEAPRKEEKAPVEKEEPVETGTKEPKKK